MNEIDSIKQRVEASKQVQLEVKNLLQKAEADYHSSTFIRTVQHQALKIVDQTVKTITSILKLRRSDAQIDSEKGKHH